MDSHSFSSVVCWVDGEQPPRVQHPCVPNFLTALLAKPFREDKCIPPYVTWAAEVGEVAPLGS